MLSTLIVFILVLSALVFAHELGHFLMAKRARVRVEEFGFGLPPRVWGKKLGETTYSINLLPIGGFVRLAGEDEGEQEGKKIKDCSRMFWSKSKMARAGVVVAGVVMNFLLAVLAFSVVYTQTGIPIKTDKVSILGVLPSSPAQEVGIKEGDIVVQMAGEKIDNTNKFINLTRTLAGKEISMEIAREKDNPCQDKVLTVQINATYFCKDGNIVFSLAPRETPPEGEGPLGVVISDTEMKFYPFYEMPFRGMIEGFKEAINWAGLMANALGKMFWQLASMGVVPKDVAGPVGIFQITGTVAKSGLLAVLQFVGILSINLALINILPIPALDGGRLLFIGIEAISGRKVKVQAERWAHQIGMVVLLLLVLLITYNDILRLLTTTSLGDYIRQLFSPKF